MTRNFQYPRNSWVDERVALFNSPIAGYGIRATSKINKGEIIRVWGGIPIDEKDIDTSDVNTTSFAAVDETEDHTLIYLQTLQSEIDNNHPANYGNHSCDPNMWLDGPNIWIARRDILEGEEINSDYAMQTADEKWKMECYCQRPNCRKVISGEDWKRKDLQMKYKGHFSPFINNRIKFDSSTESYYHTLDK
ncbi:MAG: SET domain-containing protein [Candidatus Levyibacteriota bacterium]